METSVNDEVALLSKKQQSFGVIKISHCVIASAVVHAVSIVGIIVLSIIVGIFWYQSTPDICQTAPLTCDDQVGLKLDDPQSVLVVIAHPDDAEM
jgi:hypothetical protein